MESGDSTMGSSCSADRRRFGVAMLGAQEETHAAQGDTEMERRSWVKRRRDQNKQLAGISDSPIDVFTFENADSRMSNGENGLNGRTKPLN